MSPKTKRRLLLSTAILLVLGGLFWWSRSGPTELDRYKAQLLAQGEILALDQLVPVGTGNLIDTNASATFPLVWKPTAHHVSGMLWQINLTNQLRLVFPSSSSASNFVSRTQTWDALALAVETNRHLLPLISQAFATPPETSGIDMHLFMDYPIRDFSHRREISYYLRAAVISDCHKGRDSEAFETLLTQLKIARSYEREWTVVNQMVRRSTLHLAHESTWYGLEAHSWSEPQLAQLQTNWQHLSLLTNVYHSLLYERVIGVSVFSVARTNPPVISQKVIYQPPGPKPILDRFGEWWRLRTDLAADELAYLQASQANLLVWREQIRQPAYAAGLAEFQSLEESRALASSSFLFPEKHFLSSHLLFTHWKLFTSVAQTETLRLQTIAAIALERHRLKHGHYPDALAKLIPDFLDKIPQDPMDGRPMRYRLNADATFTLYSVGFDGKDDGGDPTMPDPKKQRFPKTPAISSGLASTRSTSRPNSRLRPLWNAEACLRLPRPGARSSPFNLRGHALIA